MKTIALALFLGMATWASATSLSYTGSVHNFDVTQSGVGVTVYNAAGGGGNYTLGQTSAAPMAVFYLASGAVRNLAVQDVYAGPQGHLTDPASASGGDAFIVVDSSELSLIGPDQGQPGGKDRRADIFGVDGTVASMDLDLTLLNLANSAGLRIDDDADDDGGYSAAGDLSANGLIDGIGSGSLTLGDDAGDDGGYAFGDGLSNSGSAGEDNGNSDGAGGADSSSSDSGFGSGGSGSGSFGSGGFGSGGFGSGGFGGSTSKGSGANGSHAAGGAGLQPNAALVPEPNSLILSLTGLGACAGMIRRRRKVA